MPKEETNEWRGLTVKMPWALAIIDLDPSDAPRLLKNSENRMRSLGDYTGPLVIHASKTLPSKSEIEADIEDILDMWVADLVFFDTITDEQITAILEAKREWLMTASLEYAGCVLGYTELLCTDKTNCLSQWDIKGMNHLRLGTPHCLKGAPLWKGASGLWQVTDELKALIEANDHDVPISDTGEVSEVGHGSSADTEPEEPFDMRDGEITTSPSPAVELKAGDRVLYEERTLPVPLNETQELEALHEVMRLLKDVDALEYEKKQIAKDLGAEIEKKKTELIAATRYADRGKNEVLVKCLEVTQYADNMRRVVRLDTHRIIEERQLMHEERQTEVTDIGDPSFLTEDSEETGLTSLQIAAVEMLVSDKVPDMVAIGRNLDVDSGTMAAWMKDPAFVSLRDKKSNEGETSTEPDEEPACDGAGVSPTEAGTSPADELFDALSMVHHAGIQDWLEAGKIENLLDSMESLSHDERDELLAWCKIEAENPQGEFDPPECLRLLLDEEGVL